jgi:hypothetical protein
MVSNLLNAKMAIYKIQSYTKRNEITDAGLEAFAVNGHNFP